MKAINFYTANGWAGSNYDSKLSTKEIAAKVRSYAKKNFPGFKFSVRSEWSMYTDSLHIELKEGTCIPFVEGSRSAERGYMSTMNTVKGWEKDLTPEIFKVLDAVTTYASSFRYDDSDGMQDYYDTNFYLSIKVGDEYKVIEPKAKKSSVKPERVEEAKEVEAVTAEGLEIVDYSEKAIAVFGDTKAIKEQLKELGGRFNPSLNYNGEKRAGWIFSKKSEEEVRKLINGCAEHSISKSEIDIKTNEYKNALAEYCKLINDCGYYSKEYEGAVKIEKDGNPFYYLIEKPRIENSFWFEDEGPDYEYYLQVVANEESKKNYFLSRNINSFENEVKRANKGFVSFERNRAYIDYHDGEPVNDDTRKRIIDGIMFGKERFEKRLNSYLKRWGTSKLGFKTYWANR